MFYIYGFLRKKVANYQIWIYYINHTAVSINYLRQTFRKIAWKTKQIFYQKSLYIIIYNDKLYAFHEDVWIYYCATRAILLWYFTKHLWSEDLHYKNVTSVKADTKIKRRCQKFIGHEDRCACDKHLLIAVYISYCHVNIYLLCFVLTK
jgi:hypothetical protein